MRNLGGFFMLVFWSCAVPDTYQKQALRFEDQLALLQQRGLEFDDLDRALSQIRGISYYRLSGYWYPFREKDTYGAFGHTDPLNFHPKFDHAEWLKKLDVEATRSKEAFIVHYKNKYKGFPTLPIWMTTEVMSLV